MAYTIRVAQSEFSFDCAAQTTVLEGAKKAGFDLPFSCRNGVCGSCKGKVLAGTFDVPENLEGLSEEERAAGYTLFCQARPMSDLEIAVRSISRTDPNAIKTVKAKVYKTTRATQDVSLLQLRFPAGTRIPFKAGQYLQVVLEDGARRSYSMANPSTQNDGASLHIRHVRGGRFSHYLDSVAAAGDILAVEAPFGDFYLRPGDKPLIFVASGTGFAPIKSILETLFKQGKPTRPIALYWGGRRKNDVYMADLPQKWAQQHERFTFIPVLSEEDNGVDRTGFVHEAVLADYPSLAGHEVYACGVPVMINAARHDFTTRRQLPPDAFFCDAFVEGGVPAPVTP
jgi:NAD(P)H-flavin reductase/ferredoxin